MTVVVMVEYNQSYKMYYGPGHNRRGWGGGDENTVSAASSEAKETLHNHIRATVLEGKPLDALEIKNLDEAKSEITMLDSTISLTPYPNRERVR